MREESITLTMRAENALKLPGYESDTCDTCGEEVVVSPATRDEIDRGVYPEEIRCVTCATDESETDSEGGRDAE